MPAPRPPVPTWYSGKELLFYLLLSSIIGIGVWLRLWDLGKFGFWWDELYHVIAAKSLLEEGRPFIPLSGDYTRSLPFTYIVAFFFKVFGVSEFSGRLPSVIFSTLFVIAGFFIVKNLLNRSIGLLFVIVMSLSPFSIELSRECRMYALFQLLYFSMSYFFFIGIENIDHGYSLFRKVESKYEINIVYLLASLFLFICSATIHALTFTFVLVVLFYSFALFVYHWKKNGFIQSLDSKYFIISTLIICSVTAMYIIKQGFLEDLYSTATTVPVWVQKKVSNVHYYRYFLSEKYPALFFIYPISVVLMMKEYGKKGFFIFSSFAVLYIFHSFIFERQLNRYIYFIFPFFILGSLYLVNNIVQYVWGQVRSNFKHSSRLVYAIAILLALMSFNVFGYPWMGESKNVHQIRRWPEWSGLSPDVIKEIKKGKVMTTEQMPYIYHFNAIPDYFIRAVPDFEYAHDPRFPIKVIDNIGSLEDYFNKSTDPLYIIVTPWTLQTDVIVTADMRNFILENCTQLYSGTKFVMIYKKKSN